MITTVFFPIFRRTLVDISDSVQKATMEAFVTCCFFIHREDQGKYTYMFILKVALLCRPHR